MKKLNDLSLSEQRTHCVENLGKRMTLEEEEQLVNI